MLSLKKNGGRNKGRKDSSSGRIHAQPVGGPQFSHYLLPPLLPTVTWWPPCIDGLMTEQVSQQWT